MKRNRINLKTIIVLSSYAVLFCIVFFQFTVSEVMAGGKVLIRKTPGSNIEEINASKDLGFNSDWFHPEEQKAPVKMDLNVFKYRHGKVAPENPKEIRTAQANQPHFEGEVALKNNLILINVKRGPRNYQVMLPEPADFCSNVPGDDNQDDVAGISDDFKPEDVFLIGESHRILVWNGKEDASSEQLLICSERVRSVTSQMEAVINIVPLPGQSVQIKRASASFDDFLNDIFDRIEKNPKRLNPKRYVWNGRIASYGGQTFEAKCLDEFLRKAENIVFNLYGDFARIQWQPKQLSAIKQLLKEYSWFAIDVTLLREWATVTEPIAYQTKSNASAVIPLCDLRIGCSNTKTITKAIVITPDKLELKGEWTDKNVMIVGNCSFCFSVEELQKLCPEAAEFCKKHKMDKVLVRAMHIENKFDENSGDLVMVNAPRESAPEQDTQAPAVPSEKKEPAAEIKSYPKSNVKDGQKDDPNATVKAADSKSPDAATQDRKGAPDKTAPAKDNGKSNQGKAPA